MAAKHVKPASTPDSAADSKQTVKLFGFASFLNDFGSDMIYPVWPLFVTSFLGVNMFVLGMIDGIGDAIVSLSQALSGYLSDKWRKRKVFIWTGYACGASSRIGYALATSWHWLVPLKILDRAGKMRGAPRDAIVADVSTPQNRGRNFGYLRMMDNLGAVFGIVTSLILFAWLGASRESYRLIFMLAAIPTIIGAGLVFFLIKERDTAKNLFKGFSLSSLDNNFRLFLLLSSLFSLGNFSYSFLLVAAKTAGYKTTSVPIFYLLFTVVAAMFSFHFGKMADRAGRKRVMLISFAMFFVMCLGFSYIASFGLWLVPVLFVLYGLHKAAFEPVKSAFVSELAPEGYTASTLGAYQMVTGLLAFPSSAVAGLLWDRVGESAPFMFAAGLTLAAIILLFYVDETKK